ncbi:hypothetical protein [Psychromonas aquimarina]|uniref:hypothetical protein n=1 Tax=Psychromonas aquimarina TaxID=444919 RepID=UPI00041E9258|nr:hypothetical protein [Psychromonas aquimarina]
MKIRLPMFLINKKIFFITLLTADSAQAHPYGGHLHNWYALDHIIIALGIGLIIFLLFKILSAFLKKERSKKPSNPPDTLKKTSVNKES